MRMSAEDIPFLLISCARARSLALSPSLPPPPSLSDSLWLRSDRQAPCLAIRGFFVVFGCCSVVKPPASRSVCVCLCLSALPRNQRLFFSAPPPRTWVLFELLGFVCVAACFVCASFGLLSLCVSVSRSDLFPFFLEKGLCESAVMGFVLVYFHVFLCVVYIRVP